MKYAQLIKNWFGFKKEKINSPVVNKSREEIEFWKLIEKQNYCYRKYFETNKKEYADLIEKYEDKIRVLVIPYKFNKL